MQDYPRTSSYYLAVAETYVAHSERVALGKKTRAAMLAESEKWFDAACAVEDWEQKSELASGQPPR